ncbi:MULTISPECIES: hypothetical protein [unclassified Sphingopyxis]|uniref:hypothetical protein n=1 Tax=unclassified Sphingopyxis TaxID=2614943 RepID=UPI0018D27125|nr:MULTISPECIES: hypothetical protein [unclassified Sphingopyxis]
MSTATNAVRQGLCKIASQRRSAPPQLRLNEESKTLNYHQLDDQFLIDFAAAHPEPQPQDPTHNEVFGPYQFGEKRYFRRYVAAIPRWSVLVAKEPDIGSDEPLAADNEQDAQVFNAVRHLPSPDLPEATKSRQFSDPFYYGDKVFTWVFEPGDLAWKLTYRVA